MQVTADAELLAQAAQAGADPLETLAAAGDELAAEGWRVAHKDAPEGGRTVTLSVPFDDPDQFNALFAQMADALAADEAVLLEPWTLAVTQDRIRIAGAAAARPLPAVADYGLTAPRVVRILKRTEAFDYDIAVEMPGEVLTSTATTAEGPNLQWSVEPGQRVEIAAEGTRLPVPWLRAVLGAVGGAVVAGGLLWLITRRRRPPV